MRFAPSLALLALTAWGGAPAAQPLAVPTPEEAKAAIITMFDEPGMTKSLQAGRVGIGTCKKSSKPEHAGEVACTILLVAGAASTETQASFYRERGKWVAGPTDEDLPFPDPKLR